MRLTFKSMGNIESCAIPHLTEFINVREESQSINIDDYQLVHEIDDPRFGLIQLMKSKSKHHILYIKERELDYDETQLSEIKFRAQLSSPNLLEIYGFQRANAENRVQIYFEIFDSDLEKEIQKAIADKKLLPEDKLNNVLYCTLSALSYLQDNNVAHENIIPMNILKVGSAYKLHENSIISGSESLIYEALKGNNLRYLAPELLENVSKNRRNSTHNPFKADVYSLGICLLDAGVLGSGATTIVDRLRLEVIPENLQERLRKFKGLYSQQLSGIVEQMIALDPNQRPDASTLFLRLPSKIIEDKKRIFTPMREPPKRIDYSSIIQTKASTTSKLVNKSFAEESKARSSPNESDKTQYSNALRQETASPVKGGAGSEYDGVEKELFGGLAPNDSHVSNTSAKHSDAGIKPSNNRAASTDRVSPDDHPQPEILNQENRFINVPLKGATDQKVVSSNNRAASTDRLPERANYSEKTDSNDPGALKISESILNDPVLSKIIKSMHERQRIGNYSSPKFSESKQTPTQSTKSPSSSKQNFPHLSSTIERILERVVIT